MTEKTKPGACLGESSSIERRVKQISILREEIAVREDRIFILNHEILEMNTKLFPVTVCGHRMATGICLCQESDNYDNSCPFKTTKECPVHNDKLNEECQCQH